MSDQHPSLHAAADQQQEDQLPPWPTTQPATERTTSDFYVPGCTGLQLMVLIPLLVIMVLCSEGLYKRYVNYREQQERNHPRVSWVQLIDLNGDGNLDAILHNWRNVINDGNGRFRFASQSERERLCEAARRLSTYPMYVEFDNNPAPLATGYYTDATHTYALSPAIMFSIMGGMYRQREAAALMDLNGSGHLDIFLSRTYQSVNGKRQGNLPNEVWLNDGQGNFYDSGQRLGRHETFSVALGDLNGNGFPDAVVGNDGRDEVWLNDGRGNFHRSGQRLGRGLTLFVSLADINGNGHLDLFTGGETGGHVWLNDGSGKFQRGQPITYNRYEAVNLGDVTGNGHIDILVAGRESYQVWRG
jgi:hypothetical protein